MGKHREQKIIATVACPTCGARVGQLCRRDPATVRLMGARPLVCSERRQAWQLVRDQKS